MSISILLVAFDDDELRRRLIEGRRRRRVQVAACHCKSLQVDSRRRRHRQLSKQPTHSGLAEQSSEHVVAKILKIPKFTVMEKKNEKSN